MTLSKLQASLVAIAIGAIAGVLVWEMWINAGLRAEVLTGAGKTEEARLLTEKLIAFDGSDSLQALIYKHVARAGQPTKP